jgi:hypothetical protein
MKRNSDLILLTLLIAVSLISYLLRINLIFLTVVFLAIVGFVTTIRFPVFGTQDERDAFLHHKASNLAFSCTLTLVAVCSLIIDQISILSVLEVKTILQLLLVFMYMCYIATYAVIKRLN